MCYDSVFSSFRAESVLSPVLIAVSTRWDSSLVPYSVFSGKMSYKFKSDLENKICHNQNSTFFDLICFKIKPLFINLDGGFA